MPLCFTYLHIPLAQWNSRFGMSVPIFFQFIDRYDAAHMAFHSGQLSSSTELWQKMKSTEDVCAHALYSEDLW